MNPYVAQRWWGHLPLFNPASGTTIASPERKGTGWWAGAPSITFDAVTATWWLYYRLRKPRELGRGAECRIARSADGVHFETAWRATRDQFDSPSIERACLLKDLKGTYRLFLSYVDPQDNRWRVDQMSAASPDAFEPSVRKPVLTGEMIGAEGAKDPWVVVIGPLYYLFLSYAPSSAQRASAEEMHGSGDVYNTGIVKSHSGLATSTDADTWQWQGDVLSPTERGWDSYAARLGCLVWTPPVFTGFYDGSASVEENYEERTGIVVSTDLRSFRRATTGGPALVSPHASGSLRYLDAIPHEGHLWCYYEYALPDGSHELRLNRVPWPFAE